MLPMCVNTSLKMLSPLTHSTVNNVLLQSALDSQSLFEFLQVIDVILVHMMPQIL